MFGVMYQIWNINIHFLIDIHSYIVKINKGDDIIIIIMGGGVDCSGSVLDCTVALCWLVGWLVCVRSYAGPTYFPPIIYIFKKKKKNFNLGLSGLVHGGPQNPISSTQLIHFIFSVYIN